MDELKDVHYDAFISYRHSELDSFVAEKLHKKLEAFRLPKAVRSKVKNGKWKIERVFRDQDELPLSDNLSEPIENALKNSDYLITICTPRYPESQWCMKEIEVFLKTHPRDHILVVLAEDEPRNSFPEILTYEEYTRTDENGKTVQERREIEPLAADTRGANHKEILKAMEIAVIKLCAAIFGLNYDDVRQRHREQKVRRMFALFGGISAAVLAFAIFATIMLIKIGHQNATISEQYAQLNDRFAGSMALASERLLRDGRRKDAVYAVLDVLPEDPAEGYNADAMYRLCEAMNLYAVSGERLPVDLYENEKQISEWGVSYDLKYVFIVDTDGISVFDKESGELENRIDGQGTYYYGAGFCGSEGLLMNDEEAIYYVSIRSGEKTKIADCEFLTESYAAPDGTVTLVYSEPYLYGIAPDGSILYTIDIRDEFPNRDGEVILSGVSFDSGIVLLMFIDDSHYFLMTAEEATGKIISSYYAEGNSIMCDTLIGKTAYYAVGEYDEDTGELRTIVNAVDIVNGWMLWSSTINDFWSEEIVVYEGYVYMWSPEKIITLNATDGRELDSGAGIGSIIVMWTEGGSPYFINDESRVYCCRDGLIAEWTDLFFYSFPDKDIWNADYADGELFLQFAGSNYIVGYASEINEDAEKESYGDDDYESDLWTEVTYVDEEDLEEFDGVNVTMLDSAFYSDDESQIVIIYSDGIGQILDAGNGELLTSFVVSSDEYYDEFRYEKELGCYLLNTYSSSYLLNDNFEIFCKCGRITDVEDGELIIQDPDYDGYYRIPYLTYEEMLERAKEYIGDYVPGDGIRIRYSLR